MTASEYHAIVEDYELHRFNKLAAQIDPRINPTGKLHRKKLQEIRERVYGN